MKKSILWIAVVALLTLVHTPTRLFAADGDAGIGIFSGHPAPPPVDGDPAPKPPR